MHSTPLTSSLTMEMSTEQQRALARIAEYPKRMERLKRLWADLQSEVPRVPPALSQTPPQGSSRSSASGCDRPRSSMRLKCAGTVALATRPPSKLRDAKAGRSSSVVRHSRTHMAMPRRPVGPLTALQIQELMMRDITPEDYELLLLLDEGVKKARTLSSGAAARLPFAPGTAWVGEECRICLCALEEGEDVRLLPACSHVFHAPCVERWLSTSRANCPLCGSEVPEVG